jgi:predicted MFS family arabinose efflux permease
MAGSRAGLRAAFAVGEFRALWSAELLSVAGDQLAKVALAVLVFDRTHSPAWTALTYALTMLPSLLSGVLLTGLADRFPRRAVMIVCDLARAALVGVMALPGTPVVAAVALLVVAQLGPAPFSAAQSPTLALALPGELLVQGQSIRQITINTAQLAGLALGGAVVAWLGVHPALAVDAATFVASAMLVRVGVHPRPAPLTGPASVRYAAALRQGAHVIWSDLRLRTLVGMAWLAAFTVVPEGLAVPYAAQLHLSTHVVGLLLAADPLGMIIGAFLVARIAVRWQQRVLGPLAVASMLPMVVYLVRPPLALALVLLVLVGAFSGYQIIVQSTFVRRVPDAHRGQAGGFAGAGLTAVQGLGVAAGGLVAQWLLPAGAIAAAGAAGTLFALVLATASRRHDPQLPIDGHVDPY